MKVNEEIDALEVMGINLIKYLVAPKSLAMITAVPSVTALAILIMIVGGLGGGGLRGRGRKPDHVTETLSRSSRRTS